MKTLKPGDKHRPIVGVQINLAPQINFALLRLEFIKYPGQKPFTSETYSADAGALEALAQRLLEAAAALRTTPAASPASKTH